MIKLTLPYPVSANKAWRPFKLKGKLRLVPTEEAKAWKRQVGFICMANGIRNPVDDLVDVSVYLYPRRPNDWVKRAEAYPGTWQNSVKSLDLDNCLKLTIDGLKDIVFGDDSKVRRVYAERMVPDEHGARIVVTIKPYRSGHDSGAE